MADIVGFADFVLRRLDRNASFPVLRPARNQASFTPRDRADLSDWSARGYRVAMCSSEMGAFAMLYQDGAPWASWGLVRQGREILLWDCVTLADIGRYRSMAAALAAVPVDDERPPVPNVIQFGAGRGRQAALA